MRTFMLLLVVALCTSGVFAQSQQTQSDIQIGTTLEIGKPETTTYTYIHFPRENMIIKRGGIANYKSVRGKIVVVTAFKEKKNGTKVALLKRKDGGRFFGSHTVVEADVTKAMQTGELRAL